jgi:2-oxoglutarate ferredoxin oxidoreductase subunit delta
METKKKSKKRYQITVNEEWCKGYGCQICIGVCPTGVFGMKGLKASAKKPEACIGCLLCEIQCPDFAITVDEEKEENHD